MEVRKFAPWLHVFGLANSALAVIIIAVVIPNRFTSFSPLFCPGGDGLLRNRFG
jgi:hypothetical protein